VRVCSEAAHGHGVVGATKTKAQQAPRAEGNQGTFDLSWFP